MANINCDIKKLKRGELIGTIATVVCGLVLVFFVIGISVSSVKGMRDFQLATIIVSAALTAASATVAAYCNVKFGGALDRAVKRYIVDVFVENAEAVHPERNSLSFYISVNESVISLHANGYKENITFDFTPLGKLSFMRKAFVVSEIETRLCVTFCRLYLRGVKYSEVGFAERSGTKKKTGKLDFIIKNGEPDKKAYKVYLKNK